jgi:hypothetical protein
MSVDFLGDGVALRSKGDIVSNDGTSFIAIPSGSNGYVLSSNSTATSGLEWIAPQTTGSEAYTSIAFTSVTASTATVTFSSIPATYKDLEIRIVARGTEAAIASTIEMTTNTSGSYLRVSGRVQEAAINIANTSSTESKFALPLCIAASSTTTNTFSFCKAVIHHYSNTTTGKPVEMDGYMVSVSPNNGRSAFLVGVYREPTAISQVSFTLASGSFDVGSTFQLFGVL